jgi:hypothetical protein
MSGECRKSSKAQLALAIGRGVGIAAWARANDVPRSTAFRWAEDPMVRKAVESYRRRALDEAIGRMTKQSTFAADGIITIAKEATSDSVRLQAFRAIFSDMIAVSKYSGLEARMCEIEEKLDQRDAAANSGMRS